MQPSSLTLCLAWSSRVLEKGFQHSTVLFSLWHNVCVRVCVCVCVRACVCMCVSASLRPHLYRAAADRMLLGIKCLSHTQSASPPTHHHPSTSSPFHLLPFLPLVLPLSPSVIISSYCRCQLSHLSPPLCILKSQSAHCRAARHVCPLVRIHGAHMPRWHGVGLYVQGGYFLFHMWSGAVNIFFSMSSEAPLNWGKKKKVFEFRVSQTNSSLLDGLWWWLKWSQHTPESMTGALKLAPINIFYIRNVSYGFV